MKKTVLLIIGLLVTGLLKAEEPSVHIVSNAGYLFELHSIERSEDGSLVCNLGVTSTQKHVSYGAGSDSYGDPIVRTIRIRSDWRGTTSLIDENGKVYVPESFNVIDNRDRASRHRTVDQNLSLPARITFNVPDVDPETSMISLFEVTFFNRDIGDLVVTFRDVKIK